MIKFFFQKLINQFKPRDIPSHFTKDNFKQLPYVIGDFTYGVPNIYFKAKNSNLIIGKFCSIAGNVTIFLGGNHRIDWVSSYPFPSEYFEKEFPSFKPISE